ncbi:hypothetical protein BCR32DRAFT_275944 [Anaeromyces robustus]|uniref:Uncharacterized protein n=1 Tax=Anaeromyces robustus TaxID=1754192 RepID=A0A1Y1XJC1_9FUNG|nr:hypothetical protein BCR32DRAFT_275944 [Anaeromyces robustus]|eukprot:ORX85858.1 hypothetical protein BCR32DRAFT_275944 [Anaeromyces robustus]
MSTVIPTSYFNIDKENQYNDFSEIGNDFYPFDKTIKFTSEDSDNNKYTIYYKTDKGIYPIISDDEKKITYSYSKANKTSRKVQPSGKSANIHDPQNIEFDPFSTWVNNLSNDSNGVVINLQIPYRAFSQNLG